MRKAKAGTSVDCARASARAGRDILLVLRLLTLLATARPACLELSVACPRPMLRVSGRVAGALGAATRRSMSVTTELAVVISKAQSECCGQSSESDGRKRSYACGRARVSGAGE